MSRRSTARTSPLNGKQKGIVSCPLDWAPLGDLGTKWKTSSGGLMCWNTNTFGGKEYEGWWSPCKKK